MAIVQHKRGRKVRMGGGGSETSSNVGNKRKGSGRAATDLIENIKLSLP
jgi:hypothetical protein